MARKQPGLPDRATPTTQKSRVTSGIIGGILLGLGGIWLGWLFLHQFGGSYLQLPAFPLTGFAPTAQPGIQQIAPLIAEGITLGQPSQTPAINQQQATLLASQLEPNAATNAKKTSVQYVLLNVSNKGIPTIHANLNNVPVWMVLYQKIPLQPADASVDPASSSRSSYDLYLFLDANSGKELLAIQV